MALEERNGLIRIFPLSQNFFGLRQHLLNVRVKRTACCNDGLTRQALPMPVRRRQLAQKTNVRRWLVAMMKTGATQLRLSCRSEEALVKFSGLSKRAFEGLGAQHSRSRRPKWQLSAASNQSNRRNNRTPIRLRCPHDVPSVQVRNFGETYDLPTIKTGAGFERLLTPNDAANFLARELVLAR